MRKIVYLSIIALITVGLKSCYLDVDTIYGDGNVVSEERQVADFNRLKVSTGIDVVMKQGSEVSLLLEADENLHEVIKTEVVDNTLKIYTEKNIRKAKAKQIYLVYKDLEAIRVTSAGDVRGENTLETDHLIVKLSSAGDLRLDVSAREIECDISSSGDAKLSGKTDRLVASLSSAGDLNAYELMANTVKVSCSSAGDARVYASEEIVARSSSAGSIYYKGSPASVDANTSSAGSIHRK